MRPAASWLKGRSNGRFGRWAGPGRSTICVRRSSWYAAGVRAAVAEIQRGLPAGVQLRIVYDQSELVSSALGGVGRAVMLGGVFVVLVIVLLLGNARAALIVTLTIPLSIALAGLLLRPLDIGLNTMTLGGLAIAVGLLVDAAIIMVENILHRLAGAATRAERRQRTAAASRTSATSPRSTGTPPRTMTTV